jgi:hypothetical protein
LLCDEQLVVCHADVGFYTPLRHDQSLFRLTDLPGGFLPLHPEFSGGDHLLLDDNSLLFG